MSMEDNILIITKYKDKLISVFFENSTATEIDVLSEEAGLLDSIHVAKVENIAANIDAAFLELDFNGSKLSTYYSLGNIHNYLDEREHKVLKSGDEILIQVSKDAMKNKLSISSSSIHLTGVYTVLSLGRGSVSISSKIKDKAWKEYIKTELSDCIGDGFNLVLRTKAYEVDIEDIKKEIASLRKEFDDILAVAKYRKAPSLIKEADREYISLVKQYLDKDLREIVTDIDFVHKDVSSYLSSLGMEADKKLRLYDDAMISLTKLYAIDSLVESTLMRKIWLKSGAYIVIDYTEAMTVIDVNTGKSELNKSSKDTIYHTNIEAAREIARQLRLRNLSGIIIVDFIDMYSEEYKTKLFNFFDKELRKDKLKARAIDYTSLGLIELTRQKLKRPIYEMLYKS